MKWFRFRELRRWELLVKVWRGLAVFVLMSGLVLESAGGVATALPVRPERVVAGTSTTPPESGAATKGEPERTLQDVPEQAGPQLAEQGEPAVWAEEVAPGPKVSEPSGGVTHELADPSTLEERPELRTATRQVFERPDGLLQVSESSMPVNY